MIDLYTSPTPNGWKASVTLEELELRYETTAIDLSSELSALAQGMTEYFASCPTCRSELVSVMTAGSRVSTLERPTWESEGGPQSQQALAVYEFRENRISRVYYFPSEK